MSEDGLLGSGGERVALERHFQGKIIRVWCVKLGDWQNCKGLSRQLDFPGGSVVKNLPANAGDTGLIPGGRSPGEGNGNPHQYSPLGNPMVRGAWRATVHGVIKELDVT